MIADMAASKLSGALPALDGSALTGLPDSVTKNASDPATDTNPSGGLGTIWLNTTSGEMFILTDATTDENVWTNIGAGSGDVEPWIFQGTVSGYAVGGNQGAAGSVIEKYSYTSDENATDVGDLSVSRWTTAGQSSSTHGYTSGGHDASTSSNVIDKFSFSADGNATDVADTTENIASTTGQTSSTHGYVSGGAGASGNKNIIQKFTLASDANATDVGDLTFSRSLCAGH